LDVLAASPSNVAGLQGPGGSPGSTLRARLKDLSSAGVVVARHANSFPRGAEYELTESGKELLIVARSVERWLAAAPGGGRPIGGNAAKAALGALVEAWTAALVRGLAAKPLSVADLDNLIGGLNYPSLERRVAAMRHAGLVEARPATGRETPYAATIWLRRAVAPLLTSIRWERAHLTRCSSVAPIDIEALFLLAMPLLRLDESTTGSCRLAVELQVGGERQVAGVVAEVEQGRLISCTSRLDGRADAWASGTLWAWLEALIEDDDAALEVGGDGSLARALIGGLYAGLFVPARLEDLGEAPLQRG
jgi:DNA-binding HxlR family transcriptional regulator